MCREFDVVVERDGEGFYVASVPTLTGCHTQARSLDELMERIKEAIQLCLEVQGDTSEKLDFRRSAAGPAGVVTRLPRLTGADLIAGPNRRIRSMASRMWPR